MGASELIEWSEYLSIYPLHEDRNELQLAILSQIGASSSKNNLTTKDFMVSGKKETKPEISGQELNDYILKAMA